MTNRRTVSLSKVAMVLLLTGFASIHASAAWSDDIEAPSLVRVRSGNPYIAAVIHDAAARSVLFRGLVAKIEATDGLVYIDEGKCGHGVRACLSLVVQVAGPHRLLRIFVKLPKNANVCDLMASIGHELWHAIELLSEPKNTSYHAAYAFFQREAPAGGGLRPFETQAAVEMGLHVGTEVCVRPHRQEGT